MGYCGISHIYPRLSFAPVFVTATEEHGRQSIALSLASLHAPAA
jgi:hypothetical protein